MIPKDLLLLLLDASSLSWSLDQRDEETLDSLLGKAHMVVVHDLLRR